MAKTTAEIRKELKKLIDSKKRSCHTEQQKNDAVNLARKEINDKYGKGWRDLDTLSYRPSSNREPSVYDDHTHGEHWMD